MGIEAEQTPDHYAMTRDIATTGLIKLFRPAYQPYDGGRAAARILSIPISNMKRITRPRKKKYVKMVYKDGKLTEETRCRRITAKHARPCRRR